MSEKLRVKLKSFLGTSQPKTEVENSENYWELIGETGQIIEENNENFLGRVLVLFDKNLDNFGLFNHNPIKNSLWILKSDLKFIND